MKLSIISLGISNLGSLQEALRRIGASCELINTAQEICRAHSLVLPGVGAFQEGMASLHRQGLVAPLVDYAASGRPLLGICLGMQLLFKKSHEQGEHVGLGILPGEVKKLTPPAPNFRLPHMGWADVRSTTMGQDLLGEREEAYYFLHSYVAEPELPNHLAATFDFGHPRAAAVRRDLIFGVQFHPEKSGDAGLDLLQRFLRLS
jgi:glutamine amidotransferase